MSSGLKGIKTIRDFHLTEKSLFLRLDLNVPISNGTITDDTRIRESLPTLEYALEKGAKVIMASHLGRPKSAGDKKYSLEPVARRLSDLLKIEVILLEEPNSEAIKPLSRGLKKNQAVLLENIRFEPGETENSAELAHVLASCTQVYINDAFGASHRTHATIAALPELVKDRGIGFLVEKEIKMLDQLLENPKKPYLAIMGGSKVSDKIGVIEHLMDLVDGFLVGGAMAYTFLKARGIATGKSFVETQRLSYAREMMARMEARHKILLLPIDHIVTSPLANSKGEITPGSSISDTMMGVDIGPQTIKIFSEALSRAQTVFWNGPMGVFENSAFCKGTFALAESLAKNSGTKIVGGGDSAAAVVASGFAPQMTHISTGGGASLEYLQGLKLPGLEVLRLKKW